MGSCQSHAASGDVAAANRPSDDAGGLRKPNASRGTETPGRRAGSGKLTSTGKVPAYELALMTSPSERTNATQAMTPASSSNRSSDGDGASGEIRDHEHDDDDASELDVPFDEEGDGDDDDAEVPSDEEGSENFPAELLSPNGDDALSVGTTTMKTPRHTFLSSLVTPNTTKKKRVSLFARNSKVPESSELTTSAPVEGEVDAVEAVETPDAQVTVKSVPLVAPPKGVEVEFDSIANPTQQLSVDPQILASFNKMKIQAQQAESSEQKRRLQEKIKDRRVDIQGYNDLWDEYSAIQEKMSQQENETTMSESESATTVPISIQDTTTWFVDFASLNEYSCSRSRFLVEDDDDDARSQSSFSLHSEMSERAQRELFKEKARKRRMSTSAARALAGDDVLDEGSNVDKRRSSVTLNDNHSTISDFSSEAGSVSGRPQRNDDYGVLQKYRHKSIEESVMGYSDYFEETPQQQHELNADSALKAIHYVDPSILEEVQGRRDFYEDAPTPRTVNSRLHSIESYLEEMSLPSVSIEDAETGVVRWREFPKSEERATTARKLEFHVDEPHVVEALGDCQATTERPDSQKSGFSKDSCLPSRDIKPREKSMDTEKPKIKTYHPVISSMSTEDFYRVSSSNIGVVTNEFKREMDRTPDTNCSYAVINERSMSSIVADGGNVGAESKQEHKANRDLLARKVGTKLAVLVAQLKENGLGE